MLIHSLLIVFFYFCTGALNTPPATGKIPSYKLLDSTFFGMMPALTDVTDPLTRLSLEKTIEALVDAGNQLLTS